MTSAPASKIVRILGVIRQSQTHDETISPGNQRAIQEHWVEARNLSSRDGTRYVIIGWADDLGVSADKTTPWERPKLGPWLTDEKAQEWDMLLSWKLDRICRSALDFALLVKWLDERKKTLACTNDPIDLDSPIGRAVAQIMAILAELELNTIKGRNLDNHRFMREEGHWGGGRIPFACMRIPGTKEIIRDLEMTPAVEILLQAVDDGDSYGTMAAKLNEAEIPTSMDRQRQLRGEPMQGDKWQSAGVARLLRSRHWIGQREHNGAILRDKKGIPHIFYEPWMKEAEWLELQRKLDERTRSEAGPRRNTMLLRKVGGCGVCGRNVQQQNETKKGVRKPLRYRCASMSAKANGLISERCANSTILAKTFEDYLVNSLLERHGDKPWLEKVFVPGEDHSDELKQIENAIKTARTEKDMGLYHGDEDSYLERVATLIERRTALLELPSRPSGYEFRPTGRTVAEHWNSLSTEGQNMLLIKMGVRVFYDLTKGFPDYRIEWGDMDRIERLAQGLELAVT
jgi:site-specific DNA recombinase